MDVLEFIVDDASCDVAILPSWGIRVKIWGLLVERKLIVRDTSRYNTCGLCVRMRRRTSERGFHSRFYTATSGESKEIAGKKHCELIQDYRSLSSV